MLEENFLAHVAADRGVEARAAIQDDLSNRVLDALETRKHELARGLFSGASTQPVTEGSLGVAKKGHDDEVEDTKLIKKLVKKDCLETK